MTQPTIPPIGATGIARTFEGEFRGRLVKHDPNDPRLPYRVRFTRKIDGSKVLWCPTFTPDPETTEAQP